MLDCLLRSVLKTPESEFEIDVELPKFACQVKQLLSVSRVPYLIEKTGSSPQMCIQMILIEFFMLYLLSLCHIELLKSQEMVWHPTKSRTSSTEVLYNSKKSSSLSKSKNLDPNWSPHIRPYSEWNDGQIMKRLGKPKKSLIYRAKLALPRIIS